MKFEKATRKNLKIRMALCGPTGSGKTYTALGIAITLAEGGKIALIDTEKSSADRYADKFEFDTINLETFSPEKYQEAIEAARIAEYPVLIIDSGSHAWDGVEGILERKEMIAKRGKGMNDYTAWAEATPLQRRFIDTILSYPGHVIMTMRSKMEYAMETNDKGKTIVRKVGMAPVQRQGVEYEFDLVGEMDQEHNLIMTKSRAFDLADKVVNRPGKKFAEQILIWAKGGQESLPSKIPAPPIPPIPSVPPTPPVPPIPPIPPTPPAPPTPPTPPVDDIPKFTGAQIAELIGKARIAILNLGVKSRTVCFDIISAKMGRQITEWTQLGPLELQILIEKLQKKEEMI